MLPTEIAFVQRLVHWLYTNKSQKLHKKVFDVSLPGQPGLFDRLLFQPRTWHNLYMQNNWQVSVYPREVVPENPNSYRNRKRESFRLQRERRKARKELREGGVVEPLLVLASAATTETAVENPDCWFLIHVYCWILASFTNVLMKRSIGMCARFSVTSHKNYFFLYVILFFIKMCL